MNVPAYLAAQNVHGPHLTTPWKCLDIIVNSFLLIFKVEDDEWVNTWGRWQLFKKKQNFGFSSNLDLSHTTQSNAKFWKVFFLILKSCWPLEFKVSIELTTIVGYRIEKKITVTSWKSFVNWLMVIDTETRNVICFYTRSMY